MTPMMEDDIKPHLIHKDQTYSSGQVIRKESRDNQGAARLYKIIIDLAFTWDRVYVTKNKDERNKLLTTIRLLEVERAKIMGQMVI